MIHRNSARGSSLRAKAKTMVPVYTGLRVYADFVPSTGVRSISGWDFYFYNLTPVAGAAGAEAGTKAINNAKSRIGK